MNVNAFAKSEKKPYGESLSVMLTDNEWSALSDLYGNYLELAIDILDTYIKIFGTEYRDHACVMCKGGWVWAETMKRAIKAIRERRLEERRMKMEQLYRKQYASIFGVDDTTQRGL